MSAGPLTKEQLIKLSHAYHNDDLHGALERVVQVAARLGMELAAQVCDELDRTGIPAYGGYTNLANADDCAAAIRVRARK
jgi:hypothetical protein